MEIAINDKTQNSTLRKNNVDLYFVMLLISVMLLLRDTFSIGINKYIFLILIGAYVILAPLEKSTYFMAFLMPLYVGLPGNYVTIIFLVKYVIEFKNIQVNADNAFICIVLSIFVLAQCVLFRTMAIANLMFIPSLVLVSLIFWSKVKLDKGLLTLAFSVGTAVLGLIMLASALNEYELSEMLSPSFRLGSGATDYLEDGAMAVVMDPNFYGLFAISSITASVFFITKKALSKVQILMVILCIVSTMVVALIGLSRSFFILIILWALLYLLISGNIKTLCFLGLFAVLAVVLVKALLPDVVESILSRFTTSDVVGANGRIDKIINFFFEWSDGIVPALCGTGIFDCNVHCMPLQVLFGGGLIFTIILLLYVGSLGVKIKRNKTFFGTLKIALPLLFTFGMMLTVPSLNLINTMFPLVFTGLLIRE